MLSSTTSSALYHADGGTAVFAVPFPFQQDSDIHAHLRSASGVACRALVRGRDYAVRRSADNSGGEIVFLGELPAAGTELVIRRLLPLTQEILFHNQGPNSPSAIEEALDKLTMISQQLAGGLERSMPAPPADGKSYLAAGEGWVEYAPPPPLPPAPPPPPPAGENGAADDQAFAGLAGRVEAVEESAAELEAATNGLEATTAGLATGLADNSAALATALTSIEAVRESLAGLGGLAQAADAPADGEAYLRGAGGWIRHVADGGGTSPEPPGGTSSGSSDSVGGVYPGEIRLMPFRPGELPAGWHACDGAALFPGSAAFDAVSALPANFAADWGVVRNFLRATLPDLRGGAFRAAAGGEAVGSAVSGGGGAGGAAYAMTPAIYLGDS